jgi:hypothetical protein
MRFGFEKESVRCDRTKRSRWFTGCAGRALAIRRVEQNRPQAYRPSHPINDQVILQTDRLPGLLTDRNKIGTMLFLCSVSGGRHVEDIRGRGCGAGVDHTFRRDDRHLGAADSPTLKATPGARPAWQGAARKTGARESRQGLGKTGTAGINCPFRVDTSSRRHHH